MKDIIKYMVEFQWSYLAYGLPVFLILIAFYFRNRNRIFAGFHAFITWIRPSLETGGTANPEKITAFAITVFAYIPASLLFALQVKDAIHLLYALGIHAGYVLILFKIISPQSILEAKAGIKTTE